MARAAVTTSPSDHASSGRWEARSVAQLSDRKSSTRRYRGGMRAPQQRAFPLATSHPAIGIFAIPSSVPQTQWDLPPSVS
jgi:hypothetical protein